MEKFTTNAVSVASGTALAILNLSNPAATPTSRGRIFYLTVGSVATPADQAANFQIKRTTAAGTAAATFTPNNLDPAGPAGAYTSGQGAFSVEPTKTANKELLIFPLNQRGTFQWYASPGCELILPATQNNGACLETRTSTSTQTHTATMMFEE